MTYYSLNLVRPIEFDDLLRVGRNCDGGYVMSHQQIERTSTLLSFGISDDWTFEMDFMRHKPDTILHAYDYSVSDRYLFKRIVWYILHARYKEPIHILGFCRFFNPKKQRFFHRKFVGTRSNATDISVDDIFQHHLTAPQDLSVFVKMDIERAEFAVLPLFEPYFDAINGFTVEFHGLDVVQPAFEEVIRLLQSRFYVTHVHANNSGGYIEGTTLPYMLEITFINKRLIEGTPAQSARRYPVEGLDFPCIPKRADLPLVFD